MIGYTCSSTNFYYFIKEFIFLSVYRKWNLLRNKILFTKNWNKHKSNCCFELVQVKYCDHGVGKIENYKKENKHVQHQNDDFDTV